MHVELKCFNILGWTRVFMDLVVLGMHALECLRIGQAVKGTNPGYFWVPFFFLLRNAFSSCSGCLWRVSTSSPLNPPLACAHASAWTASRAYADRGIAQPERKTRVSGQVQKPRGRRAGGQRTRKRGKAAIALGAPCACKPARGHSPRRLSTFLQFTPHRSTCIEGTPDTFTSCVDGYF